MSTSFKTMSRRAGEADVAQHLTERRIDMRIGIGLPAAIPAAPGSAVGDWAAAAEASGFQSVAVIDRLVYDNLDPLVALAVAAARTERVEMLTTMRRVWSGEIGHDCAAIPALPPGRPKLLFGGFAPAASRHYLDHYYGAEYLDAVSADTLTTLRHLDDEIHRVASAGCDDLVLLPCDADLRQVHRLTAALDELRVAA
jgi:hypothetical protein